LQRIQIAIDDARQAATEAIGELFHSHALVSHKLSVHSGQGLDEDVKIGALGD